jgi:DNA-binding CsgD family transcriptional regulator
VTLAEGALARVNGTPGGPDLTPTERRLADLVAQGCTNSEVAERMFLSVKTVEANLSRIYRKLGIRSRSELVGLLLRAPDDPTSTPVGATP